MTLSRLIFIVFNEDQDFFIDILQQNHPELHGDVKFRRGIGEYSFFIAAGGNPRFSILIR